MKIQPDANRPAQGIQRTPNARGENRGARATHPALPEKGSGQQRQMVKRRKTRRRSRNYLNFNHIGSDVADGEAPWREMLQPRQDDAALGLVLAFFVFVADFASVVGLEENYLAEPFVGINFCGQRSGVADFESDEAFPFRFERSDVDDDAATRVSGFADGDGEDVAGDAEIFDGARQRE